MNRNTLVLGILASLVAAAAWASQPDRAAFDAARAAQKRQAQPTYQHSPIFATWGDVSINLHAVTMYSAAEAGTVVDGVLVPIPYEEFHQVVRRSTRTMMWRPE